MSRTIVVDARMPEVSEWSHRRHPTEIRFGVRHELVGRRGLTLVLGNIWPEGEIVSYPFTFSSSGGATYPECEGRIRVLLTNLPNSRAFHPEGRLIFDEGPAELELFEDLAEAVRAFVQLISSKAWDVSRFVVES
jgi:hypothetical protein